MGKKKILFICTGNSARSQMAEGLVNSLLYTQYKAFSGGMNPSVVNPYAIKVMKEIGIDISHHHSKHISEFFNQEFDYVVTVCDKARQFCPTFPGVNNVIHQSFTDPVEVTGSEGEILKIFRTVRDQIKEWLFNTFHKT